MPSRAVAGGVDLRDEPDAARGGVPLQRADLGERVPCATQPLVELYGGCMVVLTVS
jgi:hypothetical protein